MIKSLVFMLALLIVSPSLAEEPIADFLEKVSVTIKTANSQGSGTIITREMRISKEDNETRPVSFVISAAHVIDDLRQTRERVNPRTGQKEIVIEFKNARICQFMIEGGRKVGEINLEAEPIRYSDADNGEDLAVLMILKKDFTNHSVEFYLKDEEPPLLSRIVHCGSYSGEFGHNSMATGEISAIGRMLDIGQGSAKPFLQLSCPSYPGSSGGSIILEENGLYIGMLVRGVSGGGDQFNFAVPMSRIKPWTKRVGMYWLLDPSAERPSLEEILSQPIDDAGEIDKPSSNNTNNSSNIKFLIQNSN